MPAARRGVSQFVASAMAGQDPPYESGLLIDHCDSSPPSQLSPALRARGGAKRRGGYGVGRCVRFDASKSEGEHPRIVGWGERSDAHHPDTQNDASIERSKNSKQIIPKLLPLLNLTLVIIEIFSDFQICEINHVPKSSLIFRLGMIALFCEREVAIAGF